MTNSTRRSTTPCRGSRPPVPQLPSRSTSAYRASAPMPAHSSARAINRQQAEKRGRGAETLACWYLRLKGWHILARRARVPGGEVDIVARRGRTLAFVEVKARASEAAAALALDAWRLRRAVDGAAAPAAGCQGGGG